MTIKAKKIRSIFLNLHFILADCETEPPANRYGLVVARLFEIVRRATAILCRRFCTVALAALVNHLLDLL